MDSYYTPEELSADLDIPEGTLAQWRSRNTGPKYYKVGGRVRYSRSDIEDWLKQTNTKNKKSSSFELRDFQSEIESVVTGNILSGGDDLTVGLLPTALGKTLAWQNLANSLLLSQEIDYVSTYVPRTELRKQGVSDWKKRWSLEYENPGLIDISDRGNVAPLIRSDEQGFIATYQGLTAADKNGSNPHIELAKGHEGRFLLVLDEAQFLGHDYTGEFGGTKAATLIESLAKYATHTLMITATTERSDKQKLVLCEDRYSPPNDEGNSYLDPDIHKLYSMAVAQEYVRQFDYRLSSGKGKFRNRQDEIISGWDLNELKSYQNKLLPIAKDPDVWQDLVDKSIEHLLDRREQWEGYTLLISALDMQNHVDEVVEYINKRHKGLRVLSAKSSDSIEAEKSLANFKKGEGDVLVSRNMVYIGYDCKSISVVCNLSSWRWHGWLEQFCGRGLRVIPELPFDEQVCIYVGLDDYRTSKWAEKMRADSAWGIRERKARKSEGIDSQKIASPIEIRSTDARMKAERVIGINQKGDLTTGQFSALRRYRKENHISSTESQIAQILRDHGSNIPEDKVNTINANDYTDNETSSEHRKRSGRECKKLIAEMIATCFNVFYPRDKQSYKRLASRANNKLNRLQNVADVEHLTRDQWEERKKIIERWIDEGSSNPPW